MRLILAGDSAPHFQLESTTMWKKMKKKLRIFRSDSLNTGSTLLNLGCTDDPYSGYVMGGYYLLAGGSRSGKTMLAMTAFAEAARNPYFRHYRLIYDNVERGARMDIPKLFGEKTAQRIEAPSYTKKREPIHSYLIEEFYWHLDDAFHVDKPFIYVVDSMDGLTSAAEIKKFAEQKRAARSRRKTTGSFGAGKAKINSGTIRQFIAQLETTGSILIIITQTRQNFNPYGPTDITVGGKALQFYASLEVWTRIISNMTKQVKGRTWIQGQMIEMRVKKNRLSGKDRTIQVPIYPSHGIDDIGSCIDFLVETKHWAKAEKGGKIIAKEFRYKGPRELLIRHIEKIDQESKLRRLVGDVWNDIEHALNVKRKPRYE